MWPGPDDPVKGHPPQIDVRMLGIGDPHSRIAHDNTEVTPLQQMVSRQIIRNFRWQIICSIRESSTRWIESEIM